MAKTVQNKGAGAFRPNIMLARLCSLDCLTLAISVFEALHGTKELLEVLEAEVPDLRLALKEQDIQEAPPKKPKSPRKGAKTK